MTRKKLIWGRQLTLQARRRLPTRILVLFVNCSFVRWDSLPPRPLFTGRRTDMKADARETFRLLSLSEVAIEDPLQGGITGIALGRGKPVLVVPASAVRLRSDPHKRQRTSTARPARPNARQKIAVCGPSSPSSRNQSANARHPVAKGTAALLRSSPCHTHGNHIRVPETPTCRKLAFPGIRFRCLASDCCRICPRVAKSVYIGPKRLQTLLHRDPNVAAPQEREEEGQNDASSIAN